ncbi:hypothetical protein DFH09DRAFT_1321134 [Mycena vulgaris]|nr:hypothetical protein DFH09DRAFT_1321134 [Mycena vulgaris]
MKGLEFRSSLYPECLITLDHSTVLRFLAHSRCSNNLTTLTSSTSSSPSHPWWGADHVLITTEFFRRLTWVPDASCLVPRLSRFGCLSRLCFDETVYLEFVRSRVSAVARNDRFESYVRWHAGCVHEWAEEAAAKTEHCTERTRLWSSIQAATKAELQAFF